MNSAFGHHAAVLGAIITFMSLSSEDALQKVQDLLRHMQRLLTEAECIYYNEVRSTIEDTEFTYAIRLREALDATTQGMSGKLGMLRSDILRLVPRVTLRQKYPQLTDAEFEKIINEEWSIPLVQHIHEQLRIRESVTLRDVSQLLKEIKREWSRLNLRY